MSSSANKKRTRVHAGKKVGRYVDPATSGRVTPKTTPSRAEQRESSPWYGRATFALGGASTLVVVLNYLKALPGAVSPWYLLAGLVGIFASFFLATKIR
jgi:hypothetical protein